MEHGLKDSGYCPMHRSARLKVEKMAQQPRSGEILIQSLSDLWEGVEKPELLR